jgi:peptidoglycan/xylan/chitin deacetylase (PgdA/CDA1 family)
VSGPVVLMYHDVAPEGGLYRLGPARFAEHAHLIAEHGPPPVLARDLGAEGSALAGTFDAGARGVVEHAMTVLAERNTPSTLFMTASFVGSEGWCSAPDLRAWCEAGNELGTHGWTHTSLTSLPLERAVDELARSKSALEDIAGQDVCSVSFPNGRLNRRLVDAARELGLHVAFGSWPGYGAGRTGAYGRFAILDRTSDRTLEAVLEGRGAFTYAPQRALFVLGRLVGERRYVRLHRLLRRARRA